MHATEITTSGKRLAEPVPGPQRVSKTFDVGPHAVGITRLLEGRWTYAIDGEAAARTFPTEAEAWEAGVRAAFGLDAAPRG